MTDGQVSTKIFKLFKLPTETKRKLIQGMMGELTPDENERCKKFFYKHFADNGLENRGVVNQAAYIMARQKGECQSVDGNLSNPDYDKYLMKTLHADAALA
jgi:hypothetical protein